MQRLKKGDKVQLTASFFNNTQHAIRKCNHIDLTIPTKTKKQKESRYDGYFQVEFTKNDDDVKVINIHHGKNGDEFLDAKLQINGSFVSLPTKDNLTKIDGFLILEVTFINLNKIVFEYKIEDHLKVEKYKLKILIGIISKGIFHRRFYGGFCQYFIIGDCYDE